jgi:hypothetical protein
MMAARSSFDADQPDELPPRDDEPPSDKKLSRKQDPLLHMARGIGGAAGLNCSPDYFRFAAAERVGC